MKSPLIIIGSWVLCAAFLTAQDETRQANLAQHQVGAAKVADDQDELSADVQQLVIEQTVPKIIELLGEVEAIMNEATDRLSKGDTGGATLAAQTEIIEKIHAAAKEKQGQGGESKPSGAMMDMMERMMGKTPDGPPKGQGGKASDQGGGGMTGLSDTPADAPGGQSSGKSEARRVPKAAGGTNLEIPDEFKKAFDAYNRGAEKKAK
ncbi:MAG: hypothetical protein RLZZ282_3 [Verrucomicrobiota bacterium]